MTVPFHGDTSVFGKNGIKLFVEKYENGYITLVLSPGGIPQEKLEDAAKAIKKSIEQ